MRACGHLGYKAAWHSKNLAAAVTGEGYGTLRQWCCFFAKWFFHLGILLLLVIVWRLVLADFVNDLRQVKHLTIRPRFML